VAASGLGAIGCSFVGFSFEFGRLAVDLTSPTNNDRFTSKSDENRELAATIALPKTPRGVSMLPAADIDGREGKTECADLCISLDVRLLFEG
jgi:hypothetical protein